MASNFEAYGFGNPKTEDERAERHEQRYGSRDLPPRGTGRGAGFNPIGALSSIIPAETMAKYGVVIGAIAGAVGAYLLMKKMGMIKR